MYNQTWTLTKANTARREAAVICDAFNIAKEYGECAPRDVEAKLRFAMTYQPRYAA